MLGIGDVTGRINVGDLDVWTFSAVQGAPLTLTISETGANTAFVVDSSDPVRRRACHPGLQRSDGTVHSQCTDDGHVLRPRGIGGHGRRFRR